MCTRSSVVGGAFIFYPSLIFTGGGKECEIWPQF